MDLNQTISDSLKSTPVESANRGIVSELGQQFDLITKPILNLSPHQQVAMRQVNSQIPSPIMHYDVVKPLPNKTWIFQNWEVEFKDGVMTVSEKVEKPFLMIFTRSHSEVRKIIKGGHIHQRFLNYMTDERRMSRNAKNFFRTAMVHHAHSQDKIRHTKSPLGKMVTQPVHTASDMVTAVDPTGLVNTDIYDTGFAWGQSVESLPDF
jgi:hypothetical protein|tara:strand:- start:66 stop:686 length:621 start_codon:yes stop_codon:yes gene_type:complete